MVVTLPSTNPLLGEAVVVLLVVLPGLGILLVVSVVLGLRQQVQVPLLGEVPTHDGEVVLPDGVRVQDVGQPEHAGRGCGTQGTEARTVAQDVRAPDVPVCDLKI